MEVGRFSWRLLIGWSLIVFGALLSSIIVVGQLLHIVSLIFFPLRPMYGNATGAFFGGAFLQFVAGLLWYYSGRQILAKRVWWPLVAIIVGYLCGVCGAMLMGTPADWN